jgi:hypothetical protein
MVTFKPWPLYSRETAAGLNAVEKRNFLTLPGLELRHLARPARRQSLYRLRFADHEKSLIQYLHLFMPKNLLLATLSLCAMFVPCVCHTVLMLIIGTVKYMD